jgi:hypothetical protein
MATIEYTINNGTPPFTVALAPSNIPSNIHNEVGSYVFNDVANGEYNIIFTDANGCEYTKELIVDPTVEDPIIEEIAGNSIVIGQAQDEELIFDVDSTNRAIGYTGYPEGNEVTIYLWFKTLDGKPLEVNRVLNYTINCTSGDGDAIFNFIKLSDQIHAEVLEIVGGPSNQIKGQIVLKRRFIESFFQYTFNMYVTNPRYEININVDGDWINYEIPLIDDINIYGVTYVDNKNVVLNFLGNS